MCSALLKSWVKCLEYSSPSWAGSVLANDQAIKLARKILTKLKTEVVQLLVSPPISATGNRMPERVQSFEELTGQIHLTQLFEKTFFQYLVTSGKTDKIRPKADDGNSYFFLCREYLSSRSYPNTSVPGLHTFSIFS